MAREGDAIDGIIVWSMWEWGTRAGFAKAREGGNGDGGGVFMNVFEYAYE